MMFNCGRWDFMSAGEAGKSSRLKIDKKHLKSNIEQRDTAEKKIPGSSGF